MKKKVFRGNQSQDSYEKRGEMASTTLKWDSWKGAQRAVVKATRANKLWHFLGRSTFSGAQIKVSRHSTLELFYNCTTHSRSGHPEIVRWDISFTNFFLIESVFEEMEERKVFPLFPSKVFERGGGSGMSSIVPARRIQMRAADKLF